MKYTIAPLKWRETYDQEHVDYFEKYKVWQEENEFFYEFVLTKDTFVCSSIEDGKALCEEHHILTLEKFLITEQQKSELIISKLLFALKQITFEVERNGMNPAFENMGPYVIDSRKAIEYAETEV